MDDQLEGEVLCEVFWAHVHLLGRYLAVTSAGLVDMVTPGPGETFKGKMLQPGPFLFIVFLAIVGSVALQNSGHLVWEWLARTHRVLGLHRVADTTLRSLDLGGACAPSGSEVWELQEGPVGVYGLQGRRATMEDRYCVIQDVDVGSKTLSFLGVFDGHGGQYTAEFVKDNLFQNTISKIKQLCTQTSTGGTCSTSSSNNGSCKTQNNRIRNCNTNGKGEKRWLSGEDDSKESKDAKESCPANNNNNNRLKVPNSLAAKPGTESQDAQEKALSTTTTDSKLTTPAPEVTGGGSCVENLSSMTSATSSSTTTTTMSSSTASSTCTTPSSSTSSSSSSSDCTENNTESLKKDDTYSSVSIRRTSLASSTASKDKKEEVAGTGSCGTGNGSQNDSCYIDVLQNINYTRLLTDQILAVDRQVVAHCKARTDMSGSTAVVAVLDGEMLVIGNVGDSRAVMADLKGSTIPLSFDHKPNQLKERRRIKEAGGFITFTGVWRVAGVLATSRALGDFPLKEPRQLITAEPDVLTFSLTDHRAHFIILATDGLWDVMTNEEAVAFVRDHLHEPDHGAKALTMHAFHRGSQDNITVAILNVSKLLRKVRWLLCLCTFFTC
ncbi:hypothetical protein O3P69_020274 [Scylla paramamosain]|uniref:PPM-type phosphatase domain-containing protein n=1 Tax=Scylla paramamosain TaxID=85552 RepID=A0AAW0TM09_SCYPA